MLFTVSSKHFTAGRHHFGAIPCTRQLFLYSLSSPDALQSLLLPISVASNPDALCPLTVSLNHSREPVFITDWMLIAGWQVESFALSRDHNARHPVEMERLRSSGVQPGVIAYCSELRSCWPVAERMLVRTLCDAHIWTLSGMVV